MDILVIDDRPARRMELEEFLKGSHHAIHTVDSLEAAQPILENKGSSLIIARWGISELTGEALAHWLRTTGLAELRYLIFQVTAEQVKGTNMLHSVADDMLVDPLDADELRTRLAVGERVLRLESDLRRTASRLDKQVMIDDLTGLMNRSALYRFSGQEMARTRRNAQPLSIMLIHLDGFKETLKKYGKSAADRALGHVAALLRHSVRPYDQIGRWSEDEFLVILPDTESEQASQVAERVVAGLSQPVQDNAGELIFVKVSVGLHTWHPGRGRVLDFDKLMREAERAMSRASKDGGNRVQRSSSGTRPRLAQ